MTKLFTQAQILEEILVREKEISRLQKEIKRFQNIHEHFPKRESDERDAQMQPYRYFSSNYHCACGTNYTVGAHEKPNLRKDSYRIESRGVK